MNANQQTRRVDLSKLPPEERQKVLEAVNKEQQARPVAKALPTAQHPIGMMFPLGKTTLKLELTAQVTEAEYNTMLQLISMARPALVKSEVAT